MRIHQEKYLKKIIFARQNKIREIKEERRIHHEKYLKKLIFARQNNFQ